MLKKNKLPISEKKKALPLKKAQFLIKNPDLTKFIHHPDQKGAYLIAKQQSSLKKMNIFFKNYKPAQLTDDKDEKMLKDEFFIFARDKNGDVIEDLPVIVTNKFFSTSNINSDAKNVTIGKIDKQFSTPSIVSISELGEIEGMIKNGYEEYLKKFSNVKSEINLKDAENKVTKRDFFLKANAKPPIKPSLKMEQINHNVGTNENLVNQFSSVNCFAIKYQDKREKQTCSTNGSIQDFNRLNIKQNIESRGI